LKRLILCCFLVLGCGKKDAPVTEQPVATKPSASASASAAPEKPAGPLTLKGAYTAKQGEVRMPADAPPFIHPESKEGLGEGELEVTLPGRSGAVTGKSKGALGAQVFDGWLEEGRLTGTLRPAEGAAAAMWGLVDATVDGAGEARVIKGTVRASGHDGKVVREAAFTLDKKG